MTDPPALYVVLREVFYEAEADVVGVCTTLERAEGLMAREMASDVVSTSLPSYSRNVGREYDSTVRYLATNGQSYRVVTCPLFGEVNEILTPLV